jgi:hypothetical protein
MYATIRRYDHVAGSLDDLMRAGRALAARLSQAPGFVSYAAVDAGPGVLASVSFFETEADLVAADRLVAAWVAEHLAALLPQPSQAIGGEVVVQRGL